MSTLEDLCLQQHMDTRHLKGTTWVESVEDVMQHKYVKNVQQGQKIEYS